VKSSVVALRGPRVPLSPRARPLIELNQPPHGAVKTVMKRRRRLGLRLAGAGLLAATGAIHLDLYLTGYRTIPTIGWLFLLQVIAAFCLSAAVLMTGSRLAAAAGAGFALSTLGGYLLSAWIGLFGFTEVRTTAGITAGSIEVAAFAALAVLAAVPAAPDHRAGRAAARSPLPARMQAGVPGAGLTVAGLSIVALVLLGITAARAGGPAPAAAAAGTSLKAAKIRGVTVLTNARGYTLYWFAPDTPAKSQCYGSCAAYWPPVTGKPSAGLGVTGRLAAITRSDGSTQATYDGHPLYTYVGDSTPGQANGNNLNLNGGLWHEVTASGQ
jgi:predicted lipoprotein with Yx(FWY)xxD motif